MGKYTGDNNEEVFPSVLCCFELIRRLPVPFYKSVPLHLPQKQLWRPV